MGLLGTLIGIVFIVVVVALAWQYISGFVFEIITEGQKQFTQVQTSNKIKTTATEDELICDLSIDVFVELDPFSRIAHVDPAMAKEYIWSDCNPASAIPLSSLLDLGFGDLLAFMQLGFLEGFSDQQLETFIRLTDDKTGEIRDRFTDPNLIQDQFAQVGLLQGRVAFQENFFIKNIPSRDYDLEVFYQVKFESLDGFIEQYKINEDGVFGSPYRDRICAVGKSSC